MGNRWQVEPRWGAIAYVYLWEAIKVRNEVTGEYFTLEVTTGEVNNLVWSPDGSHIAYVVNNNEISIVRRDLTHDFCVVQGLGEGEE